MFGGRSVCVTLETDANYTGDWIERYSKGVTSETDSDIEGMCVTVNMCMCTLCICTCTIPVCVY